jgi:manganese/zinc/iron transport system permease protein
LRRAARRAKSARLIEWIGEQLRFTKRGEIEAARLTRQHRLWELYLITHADVAPGRVDRDADAIEHVLEPDVVAELEALLEQERVTVPQSPHTLIGTNPTPTIDPGRP